MEAVATMQPIDLLLGQGSAEELASMRLRVGAEPHLAIEVAETVALLEQLRQCRVEPSALYAAKLADVVRRAERRLQPVPTTTWRTWVIAAAAAGIAFAVLAWTDPLSLRGPRISEIVRSTTPAPVVEPSIDEALVVQSEVARTPAEIEVLESLQAMRQRFELESASRLTAALDKALQPAVDPLGNWIRPRNTLALLRLDHELRARDDVRRRAMLVEAGGVLADVRVQELADSIADELRATLPGRSPVELGDVAFAVRALIAAGAAAPRRAKALEVGGDWLAARLPGSRGATLATALAALIEVAAVTGSHVELVTEAGQRLVDEVLQADAETWGRRRPDLLTAHVPAATIGDAGRMLAVLPGLGIAAERCTIVRQLLLGQLRERTDLVDGPEVFAAIVFGFGDLLAEPEHAELVRQLRRWKPALLAPDFATVHQIAWGLEPGRIGFTRLQRELRQLTVLQAPERLFDRAALCMSLATNYAAHRDVSLLRFASGD